MKSKKKIYNLRIVPPAPIYDEVSSFKKTFIDTFGKQPLSKSKPHITLAIFEMEPNNDDLLIKTFDKLSHINPFKLEIGGFGSFKGDQSNVLLLEIVMTDVIGQIHVKTRDLWTNDLQKDIEDLTISTIPHMTISRTQSTEMLDTGLDLFKKMGYSKKYFYVDHLLLISRPPGNTWDWEHRIQLTH